MQRTSSVKKHTRSVKETVVIYLLGVSICVYFGFLCGAVWISGNDFNEFMNNFQSFVIEGHHYIVGVTEATWKFVLTYMIGWSMAFIIIFTRIEHPFAGEEYGRARWGEAKEFTRQFANHDEKNEVEVVTGDVRLTHPLRVNTANYWIAEGVYLSIHNEKTSNLNMLVVGPPGSGKSFRLARPLLSQLCGNFLATDPKGELYKQTGQYFEDNGYEVMVMNVESEDGMPMSIHFNPFRYIRNESDIMSIAGILMKATTPAEDNGSSDQFFEQSAEVLLVMVASSLSIISSAFERILKPLVLMPFAGIAVAMGAGGHEISRSMVQFLKTFFGFCISGAMMVVIIKTGCVMCTELVSDALYGTNDMENCIMITVQAAITPIVIAGLVKGTDGMIQRMF